MLFDTYNPSCTCKMHHLIKMRFCQPQKELESDFSESFPIKRFNTMHSVVHLWASSLALSPLDADRSNYDQHFSSLSCLPTHHQAPQLKVMNSFCVGLKWGLFWRVLKWEKARLTYITKDCLHMPIKNQLCLKCNFCYQIINTPGIKGLCTILSMCPGSKLHTCMPTLISILRKIFMSFS